MNDTRTPVALAADDSLDPLPLLGPADYRLFLDVIPDFVLVKGPNSRLLWANRAFREFYGMTNDELKGLRDAPFVDPDFTKQYVRDDAWVFANGKVLDIPCEPVTRFDGTVHYYHTVKTPIFDREGKVVMSLGISRDITSTRAAEMALLQASKLASLGEMAGGIAHEINNPLAIIQGRAVNLIQCLKTDPSNVSRLESFAQGILTTAERIAKIVRGLRSFARDGDRDPVREENLARVVADTLELCRERIRNHGIELRVDAIPETLKVHCRATQIAQVLVNLLNNAHDAVQGKPGAWISLGVGVVSDGIEIRVSDSGPGIAPEIRKKLMEPFFTTKPAGAGSGLGLSISRRIADEHGGRLYLAENAPTTTFVLFLPAGLKD